jgi:serine protease
MLFALAAALTVPALAQSPATAEARVIVRFKPQADSVRAKALSLKASRLEAREIAQTRATALGLRTGQALAAGRSLDERTHVVMARGLTAAQLVRKLAADSEVELVAVDERRRHMAVPNDPLFGTAAVNAETTSGNVQARVIDQWYLKAPGSTTNPAVVSSINAPAAWDMTPGSTGVVIAVLDTGVRADHPDLSGQIVSGYDMIGFSYPGSMSTAIANDGDGADADPADPGDWVTNADVTGGLLGTNCTSEDVGNSSWHGTRVSGLIAATANNGLGMAGVGRFKILPIRVLGKCGGYDSDIIAGMKWAAGLAVPGLPTNANKAKVLNLSLGGGGSCSTLYRDAISAVNATGATIVVAAGNSKGEAVGSPGNCANVITVAALRHVGTKVGFSSLGPEVTVAAPGGNCINTLSGQPCLYPMVSTTNSGTTTPVVADAAYTGSGSSVGTSFSAPVVAGIVGLMASVRPDLTAAEATQILQSTVRAFPTTGGSSGVPQCMPPTTTAQDECYCTTSTCGAGMVDAGAAVAKALQMSGGAVNLAESPASNLQAGQTLTLTASTVGLPSNRTIVSTAWSVVASGGIASSFASQNTTTATIVPSGAGTFTVRADATDNLGTVYHQTATVSVAAAVTTGGSSGGSTSSGGGGAASAAWLLALLLAAVSLKRPMPQPRRCRP